MKVKTHLRVARQVAKEFNMSLRAKLAFYFGTMIPDIAPLYHPHYYNKSCDYVFHVLEKLANKRSTLSFFKRGIMTHYVTDFCCSAHFEGLGVLKEHNAYERKLEDFSKENIQKLSRIADYNDNMFELGDVLKAYRKCERFNCTYDFCFAVIAGRTLVRRYTPYAAMQPITLNFEPFIIDPFVLDFDFTIPYFQDIKKLK